MPVNYASQISMENSNVSYNCTTHRVHKVKGDQKEKRETKVTQDPRVSLGSQERSADRDRRACRERVETQDFL